MAKIVSAVPKLLTATLGGLASNPPKPVAMTPAVATTVTPATAEIKSNTDIAGPDLSDDLAKDLGGIDARSKGRVGTITTSFRGVLNDTHNALPRRTLLGE